MQQMTQDGSVLQCQGELNRKVIFKPSNVLSRTHRALTLAVRKRAAKESRLLKYAETLDPEQARDERRLPRVSRFCALPLCPSVRGTSMLNSACLFIV